MSWEIDPFHSLVEFSTKHLMIATVKGRFPEVHGTIHLDPKHPEKSWVKANVKTASITTGVPQRDAHLRSADFFEVTRYPTIAFESTKVELVGQNRCFLYGNLALCGVVRVVQFRVEYTGRSQDQFTDAWRVGMYAATVIDRRDFGMMFDQVKTGIALVGYKVLIEVNAEAILM